MHQSEKCNKALNLLVIDGNIGDVVLLPNSLGL